MFFLLINIHCYLPETTMDSVLTSLFTVATVFPSNCFHQKYVYRRQFQSICVLSSVIPKNMLQQTLLKRLARLYIFVSSVSLIEVLRTFHYKIHVEDTISK